MEQDFRLGSIDGIPVGINWSILFIFVLLVWELADLILPDYVRHQSHGVYWLVALVTTILFFLSILAHEISHSIVAKRNGIGVRRITFWLFGGVSELEGDALTPGADLRIAVVGPLTSFVLAGVFGALGLVFSATGVGGVIGSAFGWLAWMNLILGAFNIVPAAPLDGGRVLRAILWRRTGDRLRAATSASRAGQSFGYMLIVFGVLEFLSVGVIGLWFVFMGWFLLTAARSEEGSTVLRSSLANVHARDLMTPDPVTFSSSMTVADLLGGQLHRYHFNTYPLVDHEGKLVGLATMGRIRRVAPDLRTSTRLIDIAAPLADVPTATPGQAIPELFQRMQASPDGRALVLAEQGELVGIVSPSDIARYVQLSMLRAGGRSAPSR